MTLFLSCMFCGATTTIKKVISGSFLQIIQTCSSCNKKQTWESQPFIGSIPLGNILMSASILFSRSLPSKALKPFEFLSLSSITRKTFFRHQTQYLQQAVLSTWKHNQEMLFSELRERQSPIVVAGDGQADSPGHSAKYGSYSFLELNCNKIIDMKLVQVGSYMSPKVLINMLISCKV